MDEFFSPETDLEDELDSANPLLQETFSLIGRLDKEDQYTVQVFLSGILPPPDADKIDLSVEIATQLRNCKQLLAEAMSNKFLPMNQKTAAMNAANRAIAALTSLQASVYNIERVKTFEEAVMATLKGHADAEQLVRQIKETFERKLGDKIGSRST